MKVIYEGNEVNVPADGNVDDVISALTELFPQLANASRETNENGDVVLSVPHGTKA